MMKAALGKLNAVVEKGLFLLQFVADMYFKTTVEKVLLTDCSNHLHGCHLFLIY